MGWIIGCTSRPYNELDFPETCKCIARAGYSDVAVFGNIVNSNSSKEDVSETCSAANDAGLNPSMLLGGTDLSGNIQKAVDDYRRLIDNAAALGTKWLLDCGTGDEAQYSNYFELMRQCAPHAQMSGLRITMKPHGGISLTINDLIRANDEVDHPAFGICYDPGNIIYYTKGQLRPEPYAEKIASRATTFIIKDCAVTDGEPNVMVNPGDGLVDFRKVIGDLVSNGFDGPLYLECVAGKTVDDINRDIVAALCFVRNIVADH